MNRSYKVIWNQSLNCFMAVAEYAKSRGKSSSHVVSSTSTASAAISSGARLLRLSSLTVALAATGMTLSSQVFAETGTLGGSSSQASSTAISPTTAQCGPLTEATIAGTATNSTAIGCGTTITSAPDSVAIGRQNTVTATNNSGQQINERRGGTDPRLYPTGATSYLGTAVAIGNTNSVGAAGGVALGNNNQVTGGFHGIALGQGNLTSGGYAVGLGVGNLSSGVSSVAVGTANEATGNTAIALGRQTYSRADSGIAAGNIATVEAGATNGIALGTSANVAAAGVNSVAVGANANATITNSVALGSGSTTTAPSGNSFLTNVAAVPANGVVSVGSATANRRIQNVAGGSAATDAVNVAQLTQQNTLTNKQGTDTAAALGGNSTYTAATGAVSAPSYSLNNGTVTATNVGAALSSIDGRTINNTANIATNATNITGLQSQTFRLRANTDPATAVGSNDTVTFLDGSNVNITRTGNNVTIGTSLTPTFTTVTSTGAMNAGGALTVTGASNLNGGANLNNNKITGLAKGTNATDAVNFSQLAESELTSSVVAGNNTSVSSATTGNNTAYTVNAKKSTVSAGSTAVAVTPGTEANDTTNYAVDLSTATKASLVRADTAVQTVSSNDSNLTAVKTGNNVAFDFADAPVFTGQVKANGFDASGAKIVNVADGTAATDAATFGQLTTANTKTDALGTSTAANLGGDAAYNATTGAVSAPAYSLNNGTVTANTVGGALTNLDGRTTTNTTNIATNTADIAKGFNIKAGSSAVDNVKLGETVGFTNTDNNLVITNNGTDNTVNYNLAQNLNLGATGSLLTGNTRVNNAGITVTGGTNDTVLLSRNGLNNGNNVITNVANGVAATDAATFGQLSTTNINVATNTSNIANVRAQANRGFNISADNSDLVNNETVDNVQLGETVNFTNTDGNLVATVS
ncbi:ESPR-type extended signal peptide-containing protein, partial [Psychrobacter sp. JB385]|uniref:ESPR-type extended signal peptide-containing protein n=1 Tax=Psychrobacter sp. JB385 TaxID=1434841 RepID=UPI00211B65A3